jgi:sortase (surface protein transpeptidase)
MYQAASSKQQQRAAAAESKQQQAAAAIVRMPSVNVAWPATTEEDMKKSDDAVSVGACAQHR